MEHQVMCLERRVEELEDAAKMTLKSLEKVVEWHKEIMEKQKNFSYRIDAVNMEFDELLKHNQDLKSKLEEKK